MKFAHMSDIHLGSWSNNEIMKEFSIKAFEKAIDKCYEQKVDFILIAGDFFDTSLPPIDILRRCVVKIKECNEKGIRIYAIAGSHDFSPTGKTFLNVLEDAKLLKIAEKYNENNKLKFIEDESGAKIIGIEGKMGSLETKKFEFIDREFLQKETGFKIFLFHAGIEEYKTSILKDMLAVPLKWLPKNFHYYASGHIHETLHKKEEDYYNIVFPGSLFPTDIKELEKYNSGFFINKIDRNLKINFVPLKLFEIELIEVDANNKLIEKIENEIHEQIEKLQLNEKLLIIKIKGTLKTGKPSDLDMNNIIEKAKEKNVLLVKKNFNKFFSKEFDELNVESDLSINEIEKKILSQYSDKIKLSNHPNTSEIIFQIMNVLEEEKQFGETNFSFEKRLNDNLKKILNL